MLDAKLRAAIEARISTLQRLIDGLSGQRMVLESVGRVVAQQIDESRELIRQMQAMLMEA